MLGNTAYTGDAMMFALYGPDANNLARFRNAELMTFEQGKLKSVEVFFGDPPRGLTRREFAVESGAG